MQRSLHVVEWEVFSYTMGLYSIQKDTIQQAKIYLAILQKIAPDSDKIEDLYRNIRRTLFMQSMEKLKPLALNRV